MRALTRLVEPPPARTTPVTVQLEAGGKAAVETALEPGVDRPVTVSRALPDVRPGATVELRLAFAGGEGMHLDYQLALSYLVAQPHDSPQAPYTIVTRLQPAQVHVGESLALEVALRKTARPVEGQVTVVVPLPGGATLDPEQPFSWPEGVSHYLLRDGSLELYFTEPPAGALRLRVPLVAAVAGAFVTGPATVYPYYTSDQAAFAAGLALKVLPEFDLVEAAGALEGAGQAGQARQARPPTPGGVR